MAVKGVFKRVRKKVHDLGTEYVKYFKSDEALKAAKTRRKYKPAKAYVPRQYGPNKGVYYWRYYKNEVEKAKSLMSNAYGFTKEQAESVWLNIGQEAKEFILSAVARSIQREGTKFLKTTRVFRVSKSKDKGLIEKYVLDAAKRAGVREIPRAARKTFTRVTGQPKKTELKDLYDQFD